MRLLYGLISVSIGIGIGAECRYIVAPSGSPAAPNGPPAPPNGPPASPSGPPVPPRSPPAPPAADSKLRVTLPQAVIEGFRDTHENSVFLGIPFADTTGGQNRWKAPQNVPKAQPGTVFNASQYGPTCPQAISGTLFSQQSEDCLNLNIWAPSSGSKLPVFVYMYGGAMVTGSSSNPQFQGNNFARKGVIFVSFNTRESIYAYPSSAELAGNSESQNFGILDVDKALEWIHDNIAAFGGDPNHIVFGGHSSGAVQVDHYLWNHPNTFLAGAVQMAANAKSGPAVAPTNEALDIVAAEVGCPTGVGQLACLREVDFLTFQTTNFNSTYNTWFTPAVDDKTRYRNYESRFAAGNYASHVPLLTGNSNLEGALFSLVYGGINTDFTAWLSTFEADVAQIPKDDLEAAYNISDFASVSAMSGAQYGDARFFCPVDYLQDLRSSTQDTWTYRFFGNYPNVYGLPVDAPTHGTEIPFFLGGNECFEAMQGVTPEQQALADFQNDWFVSWIKNPAAGPGWDKVTPEKGPVGKLGVPGNELAIEVGSTADYNQRCQSVYKPRLPAYPVLQSVQALLQAIL
ncbi:acetylcholinesterase precursor [Aaosphaeria arxii CBS 175.79]|uniref:Acetylcholinesterase n=1 Tax=Aaosphaeria arxii CBS 175.79 TaxID=1450172 RepID=A0A6A5Y6H7_9PLEO|nr:acetylcholinesterase precursor [Aaosphaeria arxii CBS 175.79]KAF2020341.1 acetylcholinesterase precursor [Aaosphaeria arxii CBS 175.79]